MGKISDALERQKKERELNTQTFPATKSVETSNADSTSSVIVEPDNQANFSPKLLVYSEPDSIEAETFRSLRSQILFSPGSDRKRSIMVTSSLPGEGKSFVAANLAISIAQGIDEFVLLVDCDFRRSNLNRMFGFSSADGLHEYLTGKKELRDLIIRTSINKLSFIPAGSPSSNPSELLASSEMRKVLKEVKDRYQDRFIIIDTTPIQVTAEACVLSNYVDGVIFMVMAQKTPKEIISKSIEKLGKEKILGIVFNGHSQPIEKYGKYYNYSNYYKR